MKQKFHLKKVLLVAPIKSILRSNAQDFFACDKIVVFIYHTERSEVSTNLKWELHL